MSYLVKILFLSIVVFSHSALTKNNTRNNNDTILKKVQEVNETNKSESDKKREERDNSSEIVDTTNELCIGSPEYCNMTKEDYVQMLKNYIYPQTYEWVLIGTHTLVFIMGLVGNTLVCVAVLRNQSMRTVTNYFIVNLAVADFMVILMCLPPTVLWDVTETWFFGDAMCKIVLYLQVI